MGIFEERFLGSRRGRNSQQKRQERLSLGDWLILSLNTNLNSDLPVFSIVAHTFSGPEEGSKLKKKHMNKRIRKTNILNFFLHFIKNSRERLFYDHAWCFCEEDYWELTHSIIMKSKDESVWSQLAFHWKGLVRTVCRYQLLSLWFNSILLFSILIDYTYMLLKRKKTSHVTWCHLKVSYQKNIMNCKEKHTTYIEIPEIFVVILQDKYIVIKECYFKHYMKVW